MRIRREAGPTLTAVELDVDDELDFVLANGETRRIVMKNTAAWVTHTTVDEPRVEKPGAVTDYQFGATLEIDGVRVTMMREVSTPRSFYRPREVMGLRIWVDAVDDIFNFLTEDHGECRPRKQARLALQDVTLRIAPVLLHPWCPLPEGGLRIEDCYMGEDCWLGAYFGASAHGGLDISHPAGTPLWTPIPIDDHGFSGHISRGDRNNTWRGVHKWDDGTEWIIKSAHVIRLRVPEGGPLAAGTHYADAAGVLTGGHEHSHFVFAVREEGRDEILLDPWILFHQMYEDRRLTTAPEGF
jgi:hypothetical protein